MWNARRLRSARSARESVGRFRSEPAGARTRVPRRDPPARAYARWPWRSASRQRPSRGAAGSRAWKCRACRTCRRSWSRSARLGRRRCRSPSPDQDPRGGDPRGLREGGVADNGLSLSRLRRHAASHTQAEAARIVGISPASGSAGSRASTAWGSRAQDRRRAHPARSAIAAGAPMMERIRSAKRAARPSGTVTANDGTPGGRRAMYEMWT